eukprot:1527742-Pyramimonas_sp.AAC.1
MSVNMDTYFEHVVEGCDKPDRWNTDGAKQLISGCLAVCTVDGPKLASQDLINKLSALTKAHDLYDKRVHYESLGDTDADRIGSPSAMRSLKAMACSIQCAASELSRVPDAASTQCAKELATTEGVFKSAGAAILKNKVGEMDAFIAKVFEHIDPFEPGGQRWTSKIKSDTEPIEKMYQMAKKSLFKVN